MSGMNRLERGSDLASPGGREQLQETLDLLSSHSRALREELDKVREMDRIVAPVPIEAFPVVSPPITAGSDVELGAIVPLAYDATGQIPPGYLRCDGSAISRSTYAFLFNLMGVAWGPGDGSTTFNLPNLARRTLAGSGGASTGTLGNTVGSVGGSETHTLSTSEVPNHSHTVSSHTHDLANHTHTGPSHTHTIPDHSHGFTFYDPGTGATTGPARTASGGTTATHTSHLGGAGNTGSGGTGATGAPSSNTSGAASPGTDSVGGGGAHNNVQPTAIVDYMIKVSGTPGDTSQSVPVIWGPVPGSWVLGFRFEFPNAAVSNVIVVPATGEVPEPVSRATSSSGSRGVATVLTLTGVTRVPYNFRRFKATGLRVRTKVTMSGCPGASSVTVQLKVNNPLATSGYRSPAYTRVLAESGGVIGDSSYVDAQLSREELGADWKPGYMLRFELSFTIPGTYTAATFDVGALRIDW